MLDLPDIKKGATWADVTSEQWQNMVRVVRAMADLTGGEGLEVSRYGGQMGIDATQAVTLRPAPVRHVVVLTVPAVPEPPAEPVLRVLTVRAVRFRSLPPVPGEFDWASEEFEAFPDLGLDFEIFASAVYAPPPPPPPPTGDNPPSPPADITGPVGEVQTFRAQYRGGYWFVDAPKGAVRYCIIKEIEDDGKFRIKVQEVVRNYSAEGVWDGSHVTTGAVVEVSTWGNLKAGDYRPWVWEDDQPTDQTTILPLVFVDGEWTVKQGGKFAVVRRTGQVRFLDGTRAYTAPEGES